MKKRWISLYVENEIGVLAKIAGLLLRKIIQPHKPHSGHHRRSTVVPYDHQRGER